MGTLTGNQVCSIFDNVPEYVGSTLLPFEGVHIKFVDDFGRRPYSSFLRFLITYLFVYLAIVAFFDFIRSGEH